MAYAADDFNRADSASLGANWTNRQGGSNAFQIISNQAERTTNNDCSEFYSGTTFAADQFSQAALWNLVGTNDQTGIGVGVRIRTDNLGGGSGVLDLYFAVVNAAASNNVTVTKWVAGAYTMLAQRTQAWSNGDILRLEAQGTTLRVYRNGTQLGADITDSSLGAGYPSAPGLAGIASFTGGAIDGWSGGDSQSVLPDADLAAGGWTTSPLFSKLNDLSDATIITATAS